jgi:outer membrane usher protein FimD/PapC
MLKDRTIEGLVGRGGEFYIENVPAGSYPAKITYEGEECVFDITIPETTEMWVDLGEVLCEM